MPTTLDLTGLNRVQEGLRALGNPDATDLMTAWMTIIDDDNRQGVLQGLDKDGVPMIPVKYRPKLQPVKLNYETFGFQHLNKYKPTAAKPTFAQRGGMRANAKKGRALIWGEFQAGIHGNLTSAEYRLLGGPPLAPRDQFSRVITNLDTYYVPPAVPGGPWEAGGVWNDVVTTRGVPFLRFHFDGAGHLPRRDLRGIRPAGMAKAMAALRNWWRLAVRQAFGSAA